MNLGKKIPCEMVSYFHKGDVLPLKYRCYSLACATYLVYQVEKVYHVQVENRHGLRHKTYFVLARGDRDKVHHVLYVDPRDKGWWLLS